MKCFVVSTFWSCFCKPGIESQVLVCSDLEMPSISGEILFLEDLELQHFKANIFLVKLYGILNISHSKL